MVRSDNRHGRGAIGIKAVTNYNLGVGSPRIEIYRINVRSNVWRCPLIARYKHLATEPTLIVIGVDELPRTLRSFVADNV